MNIQERDASAGDAAGGTPVNRRTFLAASAAAFAAGVSSTWAGAVSAGEIGDRQLRPGVPARSIGSRAPAETSTRLARGTFSLTPLHQLHGIVTPSDLHFERHHNGVPALEVSRHQLLVHGVVDRPMVFSMEDLLRFPSVSRMAFIECAGNTAAQWHAARDLGVQETHGLTSTSEWTGVRLATILEAAGLPRHASWMLAEGQDAAALARSVPLTDEILRDALICYGQNGEALRPEQGYPLRLLLPGCEGNINVKWLRRLKVGTTPFMTRWETAKYTDLMPDGRAYQFSLFMEAKSVITSPSGGEQVRRGWTEIRGLAWSGRGAITEVEVSVDGGRHWHAARLQEPVLAKCHTRFRLPWKWEGGETVLLSRCADESGYQQPSRAALIGVRGTESVYHYNGIQAWKVEADGRVRNIHDA